MDNYKAGLALIIIIVFGGFLFFLLGLSPLAGSLWGAIAVFISNRLTFGAWKTTPWGDLW